MTEPKTTRRRRTPEERAVDALSVARRRVEKSAQKLRAAEHQLAIARAEHTQARTELDYAEGHPALPAQPELPFGGPA